MGAVTNRIVIVGGVAAGAGAAVRARRVNESAEIVILEAGDYVSFANCGLPYYVGGEIKEEQQLLVQTPEQLWRRFRIQVRLRHRVTAIDREARVVRGVVLPRGEEFSEPYSALVLACGSRPVRPPIPGLDRPNVYQLRTVPEAVALRRVVEAARKRSSGQPRAVVVGAGFIGLEVAEALLRQGFHVTLVEQAPQVLPPLDPEMAALVAMSLREQGIELVLGDGAREFVGPSKAAGPAPSGGENADGEPATALLLASGRRLEAEIFVVGLGVRPDVELAREAGLQLGVTGGIRVDERMQTSDPLIFAAGDAVECTDLVTGQPALFPLAGPANKQGRVAGDQAAAVAAGAAREKLAPEAGRLRFRGALGTAIVRAGTITAGITGLSEKRARACGLPVAVGYTVSGHHAGYYPGAKSLFIKLVWSPQDGRLLGAQVVGAEGVDKRIDVVATAIMGGLRVEELADLDLAYAPPFGAAKDPIVIAGMAAQNRQLEIVDGITPAELASMLGANADQGDDGVTSRLQLVDVRNPQETAGGHIPGAILIPLDTLRENLDKLDPHKSTVVYCAGGQRSYIAAQILKGHGFARVQNLTGGYLAWKLYQASGRLNAAGSTNSEGQAETA
ncbi:MAG: FAD-dependent oxidoreductase [Limnochordales bacterium]|nr:FAD-dependent oxidoreductase [Limnochordales bacterium]